MHRLNAFLFFRGRKNVSVGRSLISLVHTCLSLVSSSMLAGNLVDADV